MVRRGAAGFSAATMMKSPPVTPLQRLDARLHEQVRDVINLQTALDIQTSRISRMYSENGALLHAPVPQHGDHAPEGRESSRRLRWTVH